MLFIKKNLKRKILMLRVSLKHSVEVQLPEHCPIRLWLVQLLSTLILYAHLIGHICFRHTLKPGKLCTNQYSCSRLIHLDSSPRHHTSKYREYISQYYRYIETPRLCMSDVLKRKFRGQRCMPHKKRLSRNINLRPSGSLPVPVKVLR